MEGERFVGDHASRCFTCTAFAAMTRSTAMKTIPLTRGYTALVDDEHYESLTAMGAWYYDSNGYAGHTARQGGKTKKVLLIHSLSR